MSNNRISPDLFSVASDALRRPLQRGVARRRGVIARLRASQVRPSARCRAFRPRAGSALAAHQALADVHREREAIARSLRVAVRSALSGPCSRRGFRCIPGTLRPLGS